MDLCCIESVDARLSVHEIEVLMSLKLESKLLLRLALREAMYDHVWTLNSDLPYLGIMHRSWNYPHRLLADESFHCALFRR